MFAVDPNRASSTLGAHFLNRARLEWETERGSFSLTVFRISPRISPFSVIMLSSVWQGWLKVSIRSRPSSNTTPHVRDRSRKSGPPSLPSTFVLCHSHLMVELHTSD